MKKFEIGKIYTEVDGDVQIGIAARTAKQVTIDLGGTVEEMKKANIDKNDPKREWLRVKINGKFRIFKADE